MSGKLPPAKYPPLREPKRKKKKRGRPPSHEPTDDKRHTVTVLSANGIPQHIIARAIGLPRATMLRHYKEELQEARIRVEAAMGEQIVRAAHGGSWGAAKYWLTVHGDPAWRVPEQHLVGGDPYGRPIRVAVSQLTDADIDRELAELDQREQVATETRTLAEAVPRRSNGVGH